MWKSFRYLYFFVLSYSRSTLPFSSYREWQTFFPHCYMHVQVCLVKLLRFEGLIRQCGKKFAVHGGSKMVVTIPFDETRTLLRALSQMDDTLTLKQQREK